MLGRSNQGIVRIPIFRNPMGLKEYGVNHAAYLLGKSSYEIHQLYISRGLNHDMVVETIH
jgi:hypothetical protein